MTRAEAIEWIYTIDTNYDLALREREALDIAIEALSKPNYETDTEVRLAVTNRNKDKVVLWDAFGEVEYYPATHGRLIDADALKETMKNAVVKHICTNTLHNTIMAVIDGAPTVQADRPHGEWILECDSEGEESNLYYCSECGCDYSCQEYDKPNFCPNCGADMRKGKE